MPQSNNHNNQDVVSYSAVANERQRRFILYIALFSIFALIVDALVNLHRQLGLEDLPFMLSFALVFVSIFTFAYQNKIHQASRLFIITCIVGLIYGIYADQDGTWGLFFLLLFPLIASFLFGKRTGMRWILVLFGCLVAVYLLHVTGVVTTPYTSDTIRNFLLCFVLMTFMIYYYQDLMEISERIIANRDLELAKARDQARAVVTSIGEGLLVVNKEGKIVSVNPATEQLLNLGDMNVLRRPIDTILHLKHANTTLTHAAHPALQSLTSGKIITVNLDDDYLCQTASGRVFPLSLVASPLTQKGEVTGAVIVFRDITSDKQTAEFIKREITMRTKEVHEGEARLLASINSLSIGYIMTNHQPAIVLSNSAAMAILSKAGLIEGMPLQAHANKAFSLAVLDKELGPDVNLLQKTHDCLTKNQAMQLDNISNNTFLEFNISPINFEGKVIGTVILLQDVTEARVLERSKDELFSIASHELRTPLTAIRGYSSLMEKKYSPTLDKKLVVMVKGIHSSAIRLISIVNDFLDTSRLEQRRIDFHNAPIDLTKLVSQVVDEYKTMASEKQLKLSRKKTTAALPLAYADPERVKQVLINLVGNAIKFTDKGEIKIELAVKGRDVAVLVCDTGKGVAATNQTLLFRKFQQAGQNIISRDASRGTGLGLYISKLLIESMGGKIWLKQSQVGTGSTFVFTIPAATPDQLKDV